MLTKEPALSPARKIVDLFVHKDGTRYFRINWRDTWEPESHLVKCDNLLQQFWKDYGAAGVPKKDSSSIEDNREPQPEYCNCGKIAGSGKAYVEKSTQHSRENETGGQCDQGVQVHLNPKTRNKGFQSTPRTTTTSTQTSIEVPFHISVGTDNIAHQGGIAYQGPLGSDVHHDQPLEFSPSVDDNGTTEEEGVLDLSGDRMKEMIFVTDAPLSSQPSLEQTVQRQQYPLTDDVEKPNSATPCVDHHQRSILTDHARMTQPNESSRSASPSVFVAGTPNSVVAAVVLSTQGAGSMSDFKESDAMEKQACTPDASITKIGISLPVVNENYSTENIHDGLEVTDPTDILCPAYKLTATSSTLSPSSSLITPTPSLKKARKKRKHNDEKTIKNETTKSSFFPKRTQRKQFLLDEVNSSDILPPSSDDNSSIFEPSQEKEEQQTANNVLLLSTVPSIDTSVVGGAYDGSPMMGNMPVTFVPDSFVTQRVAEGKNINDAFISKYWS